MLPNSLKKKKKKRKVCRSLQKIVYNMDNLRHTACMVDNPLLVDNSASLFNCTTVGRSFDLLTVPSSICSRWFTPVFQCLCLGPSMSCSWFSCILASARHWAQCFVSSITKTRLFKYIENFTTKNWKFSDKKTLIFSYFCSKHRLWVLVRTASARRF